MVRLKDKDKEGGEGGDTIAKIRAKSKERADNKPFMAETNNQNGSFAQFLDISKEAHKNQMNKDNQDLGNQLNTDAFQMDIDNDT